MNRRLPAETKHAIVSGGSLVGLLASRVLTDHVERVSLIERDALPELAEQPCGVPLGHTHGLLASGQNVLEKVFPAISKTPLKAGAVIGDIVVSDSRWFFEGARLSHPPSRLNGFANTASARSGGARAGPHECGGCAAR